MSSPSKKTSVYDCIVVGGGLSGLAVATSLSRAGSEVLLLEASEYFGGLHHSVKTQLGVTENGLTYFPNTDLAHHELAFLSSLVGEEIRFETVDRTPQTYDSSGLHPFLGFGDDPPEFYEELSYFLNPHELLLEKPLHHWIEVLSEKFTGERMARSHVTKFHYADGKIHSLTVNGQKTLQALNIIYAGPLKPLPGLLPEAALPARVRQKISKGKFWTAVGLDLIHAKPVADFMGIHLLNGTTQDDLGPCIGRFYPAQETEEGPRQFSQWLSFLDDEDAEDTEKIGAALKKVKRQIKRAYPEALEGLVSERVLAVPSIAGNGDLKLTGHQTLPQANNFWVASGGMHPLRNILGSLAQAQLVTSSLGVNPMGPALEEAQEETEEAPAGANA